ncbi:signal peptidase II [Fibrobacterota bacterium]
MKSRTKTVVLTVLIIMINVGCDQVTKDYARKHFQHQGTLQVVGDFVIITYAENDGAFLSMGSNMPKFLKAALFTVLPLIILSGLLFYVLFIQNLSALQTVLLSSIIGGGVSNLYDRIAHNGFVTDFLNFGIGSLRTGIVNVADMSITFGCILLILLHFLQERRKRKKIITSEF